MYHIGRISKKLLHPHNAGRSQLSEIGGGGKIKIRGAKMKTSIEVDPNFHYP